MSSIVRVRKTPDIRGLPDSYDPHMFYEYAISRAMTESEGIEWLLYQLMPRSLIRSFAIAIDPFSNFRGNLYGKVTATNRHRNRLSNSILDLIYENRTTIKEHRSTIPNWNNQNGRNSPFTVTTIDRKDEQFGPIATTSPAYLLFSSDTTKRTRPVGSFQGEFLLQKITVLSPPRSNNYRESNDVRIHANAAPDNDQVFTGGPTYHARIGPSASYIRTDELNSMRNSERVIADNLIRDNVVAMMAKASPFRRDYTLFRNVVELRDLPRSIVSLQKSARDLVNLQRSLNFGNLKDVIHSFKTNAKNVPNEYLSYMFGWRQLYRDSMDLLLLPDKLTKKINYLIRKSGKASTNRYTKKVTPPSSIDVSGFNYPAIMGDNDPLEKKTTIMREAELRVVVNSTFDFPNVMTPAFRKDLFLRQLGVQPTVADLYNLIPWSWLVDWGLGLGDYIDAIETINSDPKLVNWAVITCDLTSTLRTNFRWRTRNITSVNWSGDLNVHTTREDWSSHSHTSTVIMKTQRRKDVLTAMSGVRSTSDVSSLTTYQKSILGALLAQRSQKTSR